MHLHNLAQPEGVEWHEESNTFCMDDTTFLKHVTVSFRNSAYSVLPTLYLMRPSITVPSFQVHPKDECFINMPIENYEQMKIIFGKPHAESSRGQHAPACS